MRVIYAHKSRVTHVRLDVRSRSDSRRRRANTDAAIVCRLLSLAL